MSDVDRAGARADLFAAVAAAPHAFDFFALLRRVEGLHPEAPRIGQALRPGQEALRLGQEPDLDFAPAALARFEPGRTAPRLGVRFFGLLGSQGPLPLHLTEQVRERLRYRNDPTAARFLDLFHHRLLALFYRAWAQAQPAVQHDRPGADRFAAWLGASFGLGAAHRTQGCLPESARLFQAGLLGARSRHPEGLAKLLAQHFGVPVRIESWVPHCLPIAVADRSCLGRPRGRSGCAGAGAMLGRGAVVGDRLHDRQHGFRIVLGPLAHDRYLELLPGGPAWPVLRDWVRQYAGLDLLWDVQLELAAREVPEPRLGRRLPLGVSAWLGRPLPRHERTALRWRPDTCFLLLHRGATHA